jgi:hypothetical protein
MRTTLIAAAALALSVVGCGPKKQEKAQATGAGAADAHLVTFTDITQQAGITWTHNTGAFGGKLLPETMGSGAAFIDYDNDGYPDLFLVNGRDWTDAEIQAFKNGSSKQYASLVPAKVQKRGGTCALYRNKGDGTFEDVTKAVGLDLVTYGMGATVGDYNNDGFEDLLVTSLDGNFLFRNEGGKRFVEVAKEAGVKDSGWGSSAAFVDYDKDGHLDLFVCRYVEWTPATDIPCLLDGKNKSYCTPEVYPGITSRLFRNLGNGKFQDVSDRAGITAPLTGEKRKLQGKSLGVAILDSDNDGWPDIVVGNDTEPNYLFRNRGDGTFEEIGIPCGIAYPEGGRARAAMGVDAADIDQSGRHSLLFGNFTNQMLGLYKNNGNGLFIDIAPTSEVGRASLLFLAFGALFTDVNNDGWPDIFTANGHIENEINHINRDVTYAETPLLFVNLGKLQFKEVSSKAGEAMRRPVVGRGAAAADVDLDGNVDLLITVNDAKPVLLRNNGETKNNSLRITLRGTKSNRSGIGAVVDIKVAGANLNRMYRSGSSYCSQSELPLTVGLGKAAKADLITVKWPSGAVTELKDVPARQSILIEEGTGIVKQASLRSPSATAQASSPTAAPLQRRS